MPETQEVVHWDSRTTLEFAVRDVIIERCLKAAREMGEFALLALSRDIVRRLLTGENLVMLERVLDEGCVEETG